MKSALHPDPDWVNHFFIYRIGQGDIKGLTFVLCFYILNVPKEKKRIIVLEIIYIKTDQAVKQTYSDKCLIYPTISTVHLIFEAA